MPIPMKKRFLLYSVLSCIGIAMNAQLVIDNTMTPQQLVEDVLLGGGVTVSNVTFNGVPSPGSPQDGLGSFTYAGTEIGLLNGVALGTGFLSTMANPPFIQMADVLFYGGDPDLEILTGGEPTYDAVVIEFDFVPNGNELNFRYVFASEEYPDFVCSPYNDAFGFFVSGPGIAGPYSNGAENIALLPGTNIPIAINTVNNGSVGTDFTADALYCDQADPNWLANTVYFSDNTFGSDIVFNGATVTMEASVDVQCGETYHIKIAVADAGDESLDSGVFLEGGSFSSAGSLEVDLAAGTGITDDTIMEGCGPVEFVITRDGDLTQPLTLDVTTGGTATSGIDYDPFPAQINFAAGEATQSIFIDVPMDGDPQETLILTLAGFVTCAGLDPEFTFYIDNTPPLTITLDDASVACGGSVELIPDVSGGVGDYTYQWSTNESTATITVAPATDTTYDLTVSDACGVAAVTVQATVEANDDPLVIEVSGDAAIVCGEQADISVTSITGGDGNYTYSWTLDNVPMGSDATLTVNGDEPGTYEITVTDGCGTSIDESVEVTSLPATPITLTMDPADPLPCDGETTVSVSNVSGGNGEYEYDWTFNGSSIGTAASVDAGEPGWYIVTVNEGCGGTFTDSVEVVYQQYDPVTITVTDSLQLACLEQAPITMTGDGGNGIFTYEWSFNGQQIAQTATTTIEGGLPSWYVATVTDGCGNSAQDSVFVTALSDIDLVVTMADDATVQCPGDSAQLSVVNVEGGTGDLQYVWTSQNGTIIGSGEQIDVVVVAPQTYTVTVSDVCTNSGSGTISTILPYDPQLDVVLPADMVICAGEEIELFASVSGGSGYYFLEWEGIDSTDPVLIDSPMQNTWYTVTVTDQCGATTSDDVLVRVENVDLQILVQNLGQDDWHLQAITSPAANTWIWNMGDSTQYRTREVMHSYLDLEDHWVTLEVTTPNGCEAIDSVLIEAPAHIYFPNAFTPDGDGVNDGFGAVAHNITDFELLIYDRWGELIFRTTDILDLWDGTVAGNAAMTGVYVYKYKAQGNYLPETDGVGCASLAPPRCSFTGFTLKSCTAAGSATGRNNSP